MGAREEAESEEKRAHVRRTGWELLVGMLFVCVCNVKKPISSPCEERAHVLRDNRALMTRSQGRASHQSDMLLPNRTNNLSNQE